jgi:ribosome-binding factor A
MEMVIDKRFERVEKALATLINSISIYNPAPAHANDLVLADAELSQGLEQCKLFLSALHKLLLTKRLQ